MLNTTDLKGVVGAAITPLTESYEIDVEQLKAHCDNLIASGCAFTSVFGTTGEGPSFSLRQKLEALRLLAEMGMDMSRQMPGVMTACVDDAAVMYSELARLGCRAALIIPPYYYRDAGVDGVASYYETLVEKAGKPDLDIVLYNFPHFSGITFSVEQVQAVLDRLGRRIIGIKDSTGDLESGLKLIEAFPQLSIFTGSDTILRQMVDNGGAGMIGGMTNPFAGDCVDLYRGGVSEGFVKRAALRIDAVDSNGGLTVLKALMAKRYNSEAFARVVPPLKKLPSDRMAAIEMALQKAEEVAL